MDAVVQGRLLVFGEVLFDIFPDGSRVLGGAPFNVAWHLHAFGLTPLFISRVGDDEDGFRVRQAMEDWGMQTDALQTDIHLPTGQVQVQFAAGEPQFEILHPAAFDAISSADLVLPESGNTQLLYHGSMVLRTTANEQALRQVRNHVSGLVFMDVNLRAPWWRRDALLSWVSAANWVKLNQIELEELDGGNGSALEQADTLRTRHQLDGVIVTQGERGAALLTHEGTRHQVQPVGQQRIVDTVGAGDAFTSVAIIGLTLDWPPHTILERAQAFASAICGQRGATCKDRDFYRAFRDRWQLG